MLRMAFGLVATAIVTTITMAMAAMVGAGSALAHFSQGMQARIVIVAPDPEEPGALRAYLRLPAPLLYTDVIATAVETQTPLRDPAVRLEQSPAGGLYRLTLTAVADDQDAFRARLANALIWTQDGRPAAAEPLRWRVIGQDARLPFGTPQEAEAALDGPAADLDPVFGNAIIEAAYRLRPPSPDGPLSVQARGPIAPLPEGVNIVNLIVDARDGDASAARTAIIDGQLIEPAHLNNSWVSVALRFIAQGVIHILEGLDHVLLVVCLALGAAAARERRMLRLIGLVTAFTVGHSVTLIAAFLGFAPSAPWFIPAIETAIAGTVLYAAAAAYFGRMSSPAAIGVVGLLHGFGFSFVLGAILGPESPDLILSLAAFNVGIEIGQIAILAATLAAAWAAAALAPRLAVSARAAMLALIGATASYWVIQRAAATVMESL